VNGTATAAPPDLPTKRDEAWRYAPHAELARLTFGPTGSTAEIPAELEARIPELDGPLVVIVNGAVDASRSTFSSTPGLTLTPLAEVLAADPDAVVAHFPTDRDPADAFVAFNNRFGHDGIVVRVAAGHTVDVPIHVVDIVVPGTDHNTTSAGVVVELGNESKATVVETRLGAGDVFGGTNARTTITVGDGAALDHILVQDAPDSQISLSRIDVVQAAGSTFHGRSFNLGAAYGRIAYAVHLDGAGAHADLSGLYFGFGDQTLDQQVDIVHGAENCTSRQSFRGVLDDQSTGIFSGGIDVRPGADGTDAEQENHNLLLSDRAEANTQPRLEILADDVACKHGATVGQLDETALYYMRSRGIREDVARRLLINGFADQVVDDVEFDVLREWIIDRLGHADA
jgi:Fe-S cluster assembly protein SufD